MNEKQTILLVDDSENDLLLMRMTFKEAEFNNPLQEVHNGEEAIAYVQGEGPYSDRTKFPLPAVVLLDLNMPKKNGFDVLDWVRTQPALKRITIIILTASRRSDDVKQAYSLGVNSFLVKPATIEKLVQMVGCLRDWLHMNQVASLNGVVRK